MSTTPGSRPPAPPLARVLTDEGLRLFFPLAAIHAALWPLQWVLAFGLDLPFTRTVPPAFWHAHEMIFGSFGAALLGFISTAVPEWSGARRPGSRFLFLLAGLWGTARVVGFFGADAIGWIGALCDIGWLLILAGYVARVLWHKRTGRLPGFLWWICTLAVTEALVRYAFAAGDLAFAQRMLHVAGFAFLGLLGLAIARITVSVNNLVLDPSRETSPYRPHPGRINLASGLIALFVLAEVAGLSTAASGYLAIAAGAAFMDQTGETFIGRRSLRAEVLALCGSGLLAGSGLILIGLARLGMEIPVVAGVHLAFMGGLGLGMMTVFSIAGLLHTGEPLAFSGPTRFAALLLVLAVAARVLPALGLLPAPPGPQQAATAVLWAGAFLLWLKGYWPLLSSGSALASLRENAEADNATCGSVQPVRDTRVPAEGSASSSDANASSAKGTDPAGGSSV